VLKRLLDVVLSLVGLVLSIPVWAFAAFVILREDGRPVLYRASRVGRGGREFRMWKFRTMVRDADRVGGFTTPADDVRLLRSGKLLRRYKLDEVPQLVNVLKGDMSVVGPRPEVRLYTDMYTPAERRILDVRPGLTDRASIRFRNQDEILRDSPDSHHTYLEKVRPEKIRLALDYVEHASLREDLAIIVATVKAILFRRDAS
jgi:lipopolysaccharide/colanic/teichoic acid biosynthesis glycosyltransferase